MKDITLESMLGASVDFVNTFVYKVPMAKSKRRSASAKRTRRVILDRLKSDGPQSAAALAHGLGVSAMAVRQHLYELERQKLVVYDEQARPLGRPVKLWRLTPAADRFFPEGHAELTVGLIDAVSEAFGRKGLDRLVAIRAAHQIAAYESKLPKRASRRRRLEALAEIRTAEGYMAEVFSDVDGSLLLVENHCPICQAAKACTGLCGAELEVFQAVLGDDVQVERTEHILSGARRCAYRVAKKPRAR